MQMPFGHACMIMQILYNCRVESIQLPVDLTAAPVTVSVAPACAASALPKAEGQAGTVLKAAQELSCRLLAGADGAASVVRQALREQHGSPEWDMTVRRSPAGDVYWKARCLHEACLPQMSLLCPKTSLHSPLCELGGSSTCVHRWLCMLHAGQQGACGMPLQLQLSK